MMGESDVQVSSNCARHTSSRIDFPSVPCKICGDKSSGVHYGIISCEGCKVFFRRCLRRNHEYVCNHGGECNVQRSKRSRCPACRYKKCLLLGMSKDAVRIGRIPNKQKETDYADIPLVGETRVESSSSNQMVATPGSLAAHSSTGGQQRHPSPPATSIPSVELSSTTPLPFHSDITCKLEPGEKQALIDALVKAHQDTAKIYIRNGEWQRLIESESPIASPENSMAIANMTNSSSKKIPVSLENMLSGQMTAEAKAFLWAWVGEYLVRTIKRIVSFCKRIPGFLNLDQQDQIVLVKTGLFEVLTIQDCIELELYHCFILHGGDMLTKDFMLKILPLDMVDGLYQFAKDMRQLKVTTSEIALLSAVILCSDDRPGLNQPEAVAQLQCKLLEALRQEVEKNHGDKPNIFPKILLRLPELRTLNELHIEHLITLKIESAELNLPELYKEVYDLQSRDNSATPSV